MSVPLGDVPRLLVAWWADQGEVLFSTHVLEFLWAKTGERKKAQAIAAKLRTVGMGNGFIAQALGATVDEVQQLLAALV